MNLAFHGVFGAFAGDMVMYGETCLEKCGPGLEPNEDKVCVDAETHTGPSPEFPGSNGPEILTGRNPGRPNQPAVPKPNIPDDRRNPDRAGNRNPTRPGSNGSGTPPRYLFPNVSKPVEKTPIILGKQPTELEPKIPGWNPPGRPNGNTPQRPTDNLIPKTPEPAQGNGPSTDPRNPLNNRPEQPTDTRIPPAGVPEGIPGQPRKNLSAGRPSNAPNKPSGPEPASEIPSATPRPYIPARGAPPAGSQATTAAPRPPSNPGEAEKTCIVPDSPYDVVTSLNIDGFVGCTVIHGNVRIMMPTFNG